jgi:shikimate dehydrogenase
MPEKFFAVAGDPILHSRSPDLFRVLFQALKIRAFYTRISAASAEEAIQTAKAIKLCGINVTSPLKISAVNQLDWIDDHAEKIGAINTIVFKNDKQFGYNTDYEGVIRALKYNDRGPRGRNVIVLGAGGAARAAAYGMKISHAKKITIVNRTMEKARSLAEMLGCDYSSIQRLHELIGERDVLISCIPESWPGLNESVIPKKVILLEAYYKPSHSLSEFALDQKKSNRIGGLDWLFFQAIPAFQIFTGIRIPKDILKDVRRNFQDMTIARKPHVALTGFMGVGKTTIGRKLAEEMGYEFVDTDLLIEGLSGRTIPEIFELYGEKTFRELETSVIQKIFQDAHPKVIALGGGAIMDEKNRAVICENCLNIWLWTSISEAVKRLDPLTRPLLSTGDPVQKAEVLLAERNPFYARSADLVINSKRGAIQDIVRRIKDEMDQAFGS